MWKDPSDFLCCPLPCHFCPSVGSLPFRLSRSPSPLIVGRRERRDAVADVGRGDEMRARMRRNDVKGNGEKIDRGRSLARSVLVSLSVLRTVLLLPTGLSFLSLPFVVSPGSTGSEGGSETDEGRMNGEKTGAQGLIVRPLASS